LRNKKALSNALPSTHAAFLLGSAKIEVHAKLFVAFNRGDMLGQSLLLATAAIRQNLCNNDEKGLNPPF